MAVSTLGASVSDFSRAVVNIEKALMLVGMENVTKNVEAIRTMVRLLNETIEDSQGNIAAILSGSFDIVSHAQRLPTIIPVISPYANVVIRQLEAHYT